MPSQRKRIGFLPRSEVHEIINKISEHNRISQSKVTGILVEEALISRGILNSSNNKLSFDFDCNKDSNSLVNDISPNIERNIEEAYLSLNENYEDDEIKMIQAFIEFKFFKNIMNKNKRINL